MLKLFRLVLKEKVKLIQGDSYKDQGSNILAKTKCYNAWNVCFSVVFVNLSYNSIRFFDMTISY